jgi:exopolysaccharide production protein ExoZ
MTSEKSSVINSIQVMRGLAALGVVLFHTHIILAQPEYGGLDVFGPQTDRGWMGVNLFFVLSGFIILFAHEKDLNKPSAIPRYLWRRFSRVYPLYWIFLTAYILAAGIGFGGADFSWEWRNLLSAYTLVKLVPAPTPPLLVAWTLFYEIQFYAMFLLLILNRLLGLIAFTLWAVGIVISSLLLGQTDMGLLNIWNIYFFFGIGAYLAYKKIDTRWGLPILIGGIGALIACLFVVTESRVGVVAKFPFKLLLLCVPFCLIVLGSALAERKYGWKPGKALLFLGGASYSIYIVHSPAISLMAILNKKFTMDLIPSELLFFLTAIASVTAGLLVHLWLERPMLDAFRKMGGVKALSTPPRHTPNEG